MSQFLSDHLDSLLPYVPGEQLHVENLLKLNTNEHAYGPSPKAIAAIQSAATDTLRLYPDYQALELRQAIAKVHGLSIDNIFVGNGSDEILAHIFSALFLRDGRKLLLPDISYSFYTTYCRYYQVPFEIVPLADDFRIRVEDYTKARSPAPVGILFANPNAPTSLLLSLSDIERMLDANPDSVVVVDEAYIDFGGESAIALVQRYPNVVVVQTLSKSYALAGLRVGFAVASKEIVAGLVKVKDSFNSYPLDALAQAGAAAAISDQAYLKQASQKIIDARQTLSTQLESLGFSVLPSHTNFVFASHPDYNAASLQRALRERGVLVRHFAQGRIQDYLRITVGTPEQCDRLITTLTSVMDSKTRK